MINIGYRIAHNEGQKQVDKYSIIGGSIGGICSILSGNTLACISTGVASGVIYYLVKEKVKFNINDMIKNS